MAATVLFDDDFDDGDLRAWIADARPPSTGTHSAAGL